jgi:hypothetical protein
MEICSALIELLYSNGLIDTQTDRQTNRLGEANWHVVAKFGCKRAKNCHRNTVYVI